MNWTKEIPTVDGWYWIRHEDDGGTSIDWLEKGCICEYNASSEEYELVSFEQCDSGYEFYGPLKEPK